MALFRFSTEPPTQPLIRTQNLVLRAPQASDYSAWAVLRMESRAFLSPWEPVWSEDDLTRASFRLRVKRAAREIETDEAYSTFILDARNEMLLGGLTLGLVRRGVAQACTLGYWMGARHAGKGHMTEAVRGALRFAFDDIALHRVEAACLPSNLPSRRLLERVGFRHEGEARGYLRINGDWADHLLYGALASDIASTDAPSMKPAGSRDPGP